MTTNTVKKAIDSVWQLALALGIVSVLLGIVILAWPGASLVVAGTLFAVLLLFSGFFQVAGALLGDGAHRLLGVISGGLSIVLGCIALRSEAETLLLLAIWIGIGWLFRGITTISVAASEPALPQRPWVIFTGVLTIIAALVLLVSPFSSLWTLLLVTGIWAIVVGVGEIVTAFGIRKATRAALPPIA
ncbi:HdeD family acid-resistance protein [Tsukamurella sp. 8F]|uniref:HdeD family acid-resistance protein n=1 Tax=unclassified Tsukamurella TaxID=2633480 RepID=UPI0023B8D8A9|nr:MULTISPECIES: HdeD family acid-resistance protein [unclassified Tsukamurella]MDF0531826.1 HdeD family acid-resistance protein [Tsukamurella sp. 8J]MDF0589096.1 HdeD family acid-resistance protein [Tsukamurella sp. 8F]